MAGAKKKLCVWLAIGVALQSIQGAMPLKNKDVCTSSQCVMTAADILRDMQPKADPCVDFSEYTCGGFLAREEIPADEGSVGYFRIIKKQNDRVIRSILSAEGPDALMAADGDLAAQRNIAKMQGLFQSCMDTDKIAQLGRQPLVDELQKMLELFPVSDSPLFSSDLSSSKGGPTSTSSTSETTEGRKDALTKLLAHFTSMGMSNLNFFGVTNDPKDPSRNIVKLYEGGLGLPSKEYYLDERITRIYEKTIGDSFNLFFGPERDVTSDQDERAMFTETSLAWKQVAKDVIEFEKTLAVISTSVKDRRDPEKSYNPRTLEQIAEMTPSIDWKALIEKTFPQGTDIPQPIVVASPEYQTKFEALLQKTSSKTLQNYHAWSMIRQLSGYIDRPYRQPLRVLGSALSGVSADVIPDRWKTCVAVVNEHIGDMAGRYFVDQTFKGDSRDAANDIINSIKSAYIKSFPKLPWLDETTLRGAVKKVQAIIQLIGFSPDSPNVASSESVDEYYKELKIDPEDYFGNELRASMWETKLSFEEIHQPVNRYKMHMSPQTVNAYYSGSLNEIVFPAGILQPPFFHVDNPEYLNYGGIGVVAGHELTHGFDNKGHLYDASGKMANWWTNATTAAFNTKAQCFVEQYGNFTIKGPDGKDYPINGELTLGENLADNGGLKKSYEAWQARRKSDPTGKRYKNFKLPGLEHLTPEQLFYVGYARPWCSKKRPESEVQQLRTDPHSPARWRINGAVQNSVHFAEAFNCPANAPMNPTEKCDLW